MLICMLSTAVTVVATRSVATTSFYPVFGPLDKKFANLGLV